MKLKSFRGSIADGAIQKIRLSTNNGLTGYKIKRFEAIPNAPGTGSSNHILKVYANVQTTTSGTIDFDNPQILASVWMRDNVDANYVGAIESIIVDNKVINQDIYVTHVETVSTEQCNFYLELEEMKLSIDEATVATLKDMRGSE